MGIVVQILSVVTLSIIVLSFAIVISRIISLSSRVDMLIPKIQELSIIKADEIDIRDGIESYSFKDSYSNNNM